MRLYCRNCYQIYHFNTRATLEVTRERGCPECGQELAELHPITIDPPPKFLELCHDYNLKPELVLRDFIQRKIL